MGNFIHIDEKIHIKTGIAAQKALHTENDEQYISAQSGITKVPLARWEKAQRTEQKHWMQRGVNSLEDRNYVHYKSFNGYASIANQTFERAIELGCGPFTNLRLIASKCTIKECELLDPLVNEYLNHPNCTYSSGFLTNEKYFSRKLLNKIIYKLFPKAGKWLFLNLNPKIKVKKLHSLAIEQFTSKVKYDLVVIINVIEHCYDIHKVFNNILSILPEGGIIVFADRYYEHLAVKEEVRHEYDAAHPLKVDKEVIDSFLYANFSPLYSKIIEESVNVEGARFSFSNLYYIGRRT